MYFNFEDNHPDTPTLPRTLTRLEVVLLTAVFYLSVVILAMVLPQTEWFKAMEARREAALEEQQRQEMERQRENARFVFVQPRLDMPSQAPPKRYELSDIDRQALGPRLGMRPDPHIPPEGIETEYFQKGGVQVATQWTHTSRRLRSLVLKWEPAAIAAS